MDKRIHNFKSKGRTRSGATFTEDIAHSTQIRIVNELFMGTAPQTKLHRQLMSELKRKRQGYKAQDVRREFYHEDVLISLENLLEKLVVSRLKCDYCRCDVSVVYTQVRSPTQWSLDRINNDMGHSRENTLISCLRCNLNRRRTDYEKFKFTKEFTLVKAI